jgi:hypothetical protein
LSGGVDGDFESGGDGFVAGAREMAKFHHAGGDWIFFGQSGQGVVECQQASVWVGLGDVSKFDSLSSTAALLTISMAGGFDEDAAHGLGGGSEEVASAVELLVANEPKIGFMDECGGVESVVLCFGGHARGGELSQLVVDQRQQIGGGPAVTRHRGLEKTGYFWHLDSVSRYGWHGTGKPARDCHASIHSKRLQMFRRRSIVVLTVRRSLLAWLAVLARLW